jgi:hypothetical protein
MPVNGDSGDKGPGDKVAQEDGAPTPRSVTFALSDGEFRVVEADDLIVNAPTSLALIEKSRAMDPNPLRLDKDMSVSLLVPDLDRAALLGAIDPSESLLDWLYENGIEDVVPISEPLLDSGNQIDGMPWGWYPSGSGWIFAPLSDADCPASADAWMSASMTGAVIGTGIWCWGTTVLYWRTDDTDSSDYRIQYGTTDWDSLLNDVCGSLLDGGDICPSCEEEDPSGWEVTVDVSAIFADSVIGKALAFIWRPCQEHSDQEPVLEAADRRWIWTAGRWSLRPES